MYWSLTQLICKQENSLFIKILDIYVKNGFNVNYVGKSDEYGVAMRYLSVLND